MAPSPPPVTAAPAVGGAVLEPRSPGPLDQLDARTKEASTSSLDFVGHLPDRSTPKTPASGTRDFSAHLEDQPDRLRLDEAPPPLETKILRGPIIGRRE